MHELNLIFNRDVKYRRKRCSSRQQTKMLFLFLKQFNKNYKLHYLMIIFSFLGFRLCHRLHSFFPDVLNSARWHEISNSSSSSPDIVSRAKHSITHSKSSSNPMIVLHSEFSNCECSLIGFNRHRFYWKMQESEECFPAST